MSGLTSNPTLFEKAIGGGSAYNAQIAEPQRQGQPAEDISFALALQDLRQAADLLCPAHEESDGVDGWVSLEVSPLLVDDTAATIAAALAYQSGIERRVAAGLALAAKLCAAMLIDEAPRER